MKTYLKSLLLVGTLLFSAVALADPPGRVGRIAYTHGTVSFRASYNDDPVAAELNWPVTSQNIVSTASGARTEIRIGSTAVRLDANSELEITQLDDAHVNFYLTQGGASIRVKSRDIAHDFELETPQGLVLLAEPSRLRVDAERQPHTTAISLFGGAARFEGPGTKLSLRAGNRIEVVDGDVRMSDTRAGDYTDEFDHWSVARDQRDDTSVSARYLSPEVTGYEELDRNGTWRTTEAYGAVWYPTVVPVGWAPYRSGRWTWIEPWGWTWVDSAPWGYAPSHYGRWVSLDRRWCWVPGRRVERPVWAPALVGWVGGHNWNVAFAVGSAPAVGWFPLAPREVYVPSYRVSPTYVQQVNIAHVTNITNINITNLSAHTDYQNRRVQNAVTVMPQDRFSVHRTVVVAPSQAVLRQPQQLQQLQAAPVSPMVPTAIARPNVVPAPNPARAERWRERDGAAPRTLSNLPRQQQPAAPTGVSPIAVPPAVNSRATVMQPPAVPSPAAVMLPGLGEREVRRTPTRIDQIPLSPSKQLQSQPAPAQPIVVQPMPARGPGGEEARARAQERREQTPARMEDAARHSRIEDAARQSRRQPQQAQPPAAPAQPVVVQPVPARGLGADEARARAQERRELSPGRIERHDAAPVAIERRAVPPAVAMPAPAATAAPAARGPEAAARERQRREHEHEGQHPSPPSEASGRWRQTER